MKVDEWAQLTDMSREAELDKHVEDMPAKPPWGDCHCGMPKDQHGEPTPIDIFQTTHGWTDCCWLYYGKCKNYEIAFDWVLLNQEEKRLWLAYGEAELFCWFIWVYMYLFAAWV